MALTKFLVSVVGSAAGATAVLAVFIKVLHALQTKSTIVAAKALFAKGLVK
jgi:hypothetical protein